MQGIPVRLLSLFICVLFFSAELNARTSSFEQNSFRIGVLAYRGYKLTQERWQPTADYLSANIHGTQFTIVPLTNDDILSSVENAEVDFILTNSASYAVLEKKFGVSRIATLLNSNNGSAFSRFGAVIFTHSNRHDISKISDLRGKAIMAVHRNAFGGWWMALRELMQHGIDPQHELNAIRFSGFPQDLIVYAVRDGKVDAGTIRTSVLERMSASGKIKLDDFKVLNSQKSLNFDHLRSTPLYPEWPFAAARHVPIKLSQQVALMLLQMRGDTFAARAAMIKGWTAPLDYQPVFELMEELRVGPYEHMENITVQGLVRDYWIWVMAAALGVLLLILVSSYALGYNRRLLYANRQLEREIDVHQELENGLKYQALHDPLTDLPNRILLLDRFHQAIFASQRDREQLAVAVIDLNNFKSVNDTYGHNMGDKVLKQVAERFQECIRRSDTVARFGGDEFVLLVPHINESQQVLTIASKCIEALDIPVLAGEHEFQVGASVGIAIYPSDGDTVETLLRHADLAMYRAKLDNVSVMLFEQTAEPGVNIARS